MVGRYVRVNVCSECVGVGVYVCGRYVAYPTLQQREGGKERRAMCVCLVITPLNFVV